MSLFERISMLIRSNLNDMMDRAEDPDKMVKQVILDLETELRELKGQLAFSMADHEMLDKKCREYHAKMSEWMHKAELSVDKQEETLARGALERYVSFRQFAEETEKQVVEQKEQVEDLKSLLTRLEQKLVEARAKGELLLLRSRRSQATDRTSDARAAAGDLAQSSALDQLERKVDFAAALTRAKAKLVEDDLEEKLTKMEKEHQVDSLLADLKASRSPAK